MPQVIEVTVYTLEELRTLENNPYDRAIEKVIEWSNCGGDWCQWLSEDINQWFKDGPGKLEEGESPFDDGKKEEWHADERWVTYTFGVYLPDYMKRKGLHLIHRSLYQWMKQTGGYRLGAKVGTHLHRHSERAPLPDDFDEEIQRDIDNGWVGDDLRKVARIQEQIGAVLDEIAEDVSAVSEKLVKWVVDEMEYRYSPEFAVEEAAAHELVFSEDGDIFRKS